MPTFRRPIRIPASKLPIDIASYRTPEQKAATLRTPSKFVRRPRIPLSFAVPQRSSGSLTDIHSVSLTLPVPPSVNHQYATVNGRRLLSSAGRAYKAHVGQLVWLTLTQSVYRSTLLPRLKTEPLTLSIRFYFTSALRRDVDGGLKIAQDALCEGLGINDNRIIETHLYKDVDKANPRMEILLSTISHT
jgi:crossover junction endodeoxyribonuclease RusA